MGKGAGKGGDAQAEKQQYSDTAPETNWRGQVVMAQGETLKKRLAKPLWTLYGQQIDLEAFAKVHPGGELHLRLGQGLDDCTKLYESYHIRNDKHHAVLRKWGVEPPPESVSVFHEDLKKMVAEYEKDVGTIKATWGHIALVSSFLVASLVFGYGWLMGSIPAMICFPLANWLLCVNSSHDASHSAFSHKPWVNNLVAWTAAPLFYLPTTWYGQHVISHHTNTNDEEYDMDLHHFHGTKVHPGGVTQATPVWKLSLQLHWMGATIAMSYIYPLQHFFAALAMLDIGAVGDDRRTPHFKHMKHWSFVEILEPLLLLAPWVYAYNYLDRPILFCTVPYVMSGMIFMCATQISHIQEATQLKETLDEPDWIKRQALTSLDYSVNSDLWRVLSGGLNTQALHHSLPPICSCHFTRMYPRFLEVCKKHKVEVAQEDTLRDALRGHWDYLAKLNNEELMSTLQHMHDHHD
jgi:linoleoyl-CoA desaturase